MGHPGRPRKHDPKAELIQQHIRQGEIDAAKRLIADTDIEILDGEARTPMIAAAFCNQQSLLSWLIERGANINHQDRIGYCALHFAAQNKYVEIASILLDGGAICELRDSFGNTPLWTATFNARGDYSIVELLFRHGASFENRNNAGRTVRDMAMIFFPKKLAELEEQGK
jgi:uncharacterized protein